MVENAVVLACKPCSKFAVDGVDVWCDGGPGLRSTLAKIAQQHKEDEARHKRMMESDISDPIWTQVWI